jgi:8-oxo-dGTP pyrophosphatase MutT (NUDIX family)
MDEVKKAGAIVTSQQDDSKILLLYRGNHKDWSFPKGHIEPGEDSGAAMIREVKEETGLSVKLQATLPSMIYMHKTGKQVAMDMYLVSSNDDAQLHPEHDGDILKFVPLEEVENLLSYDNLKEYFRSIKQLPGYRPVHS